MKKKNLIISLSLVAVLGIGATLAYLSDQTGTLTNKFTFTENGIDLILDEAEVDENNKAKVDGSRIDAQGEQTYSNLLPGMVVDKDPTVTVLANSLNCNVFVSVKNPSVNIGKLTIGEIDSAWTQVNPAVYSLEGAADTKYYVYDGNMADASLKEVNDTFGVVPKSSAGTKLEDIFETVTVASNLPEDTTFGDENNIVIKAAAVQADSVSDNDAAKTALKLLGCTETN